MDFNIVFRNFFVSFDVFLRKKEKIQEEKKNNQ